jgi:hypothetical protein
MSRLNTFKSGDMQFTKSGMCDNLKFDFMLLFLEFNFLKLRLVTRNNIFMAKRNSIVPAPFVCPSWDVNTHCIQHISSILISSLLQKHKIDNVCTFYKLMWYFDRILSQQLILKPDVPKGKSLTTPLYITCIVKIWKRRLWMTNTCNIVIMMYMYLTMLYPINEFEFELNHGFLSLWYIIVCWLFFPPQKTCKWCTKYTVT